MSDAAPEINEALAAVLFAAVSRQLEEPQLSAWRSAEPEILTAARGVAADSARLVCDAQSANWVGLSSTLLAAYRALRGVLADQNTALALLREALVGPFRDRIVAYIEERFQIDPEAPHEAFQRIADHFKTGGEARFGRAFEYVQAVQDGNRSFTNVRRCLFNDFFRANGAPEVTPLLCALDEVWAEELRDPRYEVRFERPTTLAQGADACRFQFTKTRPPR